MQPHIFKSKFAHIPTGDTAQNSGKNTNTKYGTISATIEAFFVQHFKDAHPLLRRGFIGVKN